MIPKSVIDSRLRRVAELERHLADPALIARQTQYREIMREYATLLRMARRAETYFALEKNIEANRELLADPSMDADLKELAETELAEAEGRLPAVERELFAAILPPDPGETRNAILEIRAGTGGDEAALFAGDLLRMYSRYAEARQWKVSIMSASANELGGLKEAVALVEGEGAFGALQYESGGHRVQRVPVTEAQGRIHTSAATVAVLAEADEQDDIEIRTEDLRIDIYRASGAGGQHVNTTDSAVRITHLPTGTVVQSQDERSQHRNREKAMKVLKARILDSIRAAEREKLGTKRRALMGSGDRSQRIRTYNFPQNRLTDHRINLTLYSLTQCMDGQLDNLLDALRERDLGIRVEEELGQLA